MEIENKCKNCGADRQLHHYKTLQCPLYGREETREGHKQEYHDTVFEEIKPMVKWEYHRAFCQNENEADAVLQQKGKEGWELIAVTGQGIGGFYLTLWLKRQFKN